jgi:hypothetical protein
MKLILALMLFVSVAAQGQERNVTLEMQEQRGDSIYIKGKWRHNVIEGDTHLSSGIAVAIIDTVFPRREMSFVPYTGKVDSQFSAYILSIFVKAYSRYEKECYADSTQIKRHVKNGLYCVGSSTGWGDFHCDSPGHYDDLIYTHREPTFQGFIQWMRKQR